MRKLNSDLRLEFDLPYYYNIPNLPLSYGEKNENKLLFNRMFLKDLADREDRTYVIDGLDSFCKQYDIDLIDFSKFSIDEIRSFYSYIYNPSEVYSDVYYLMQKAGEFGSVWLSNRDKIMDWFITYKYLLMIKLEKADNLFYSSEFGLDVMIKIKYSVIDMNLLKDYDVKSTSSFFERRYLR